MLSYWHLGVELPGGRGTWNGIFYPTRSRPRPRIRRAPSTPNVQHRRDELHLLRTATSNRRAVGWVKRTPPGFEFAVKLYQKFTHPKMALDKTAVQAADVDAFKSGIEPLAAAGRLGPLLAQFPASFKDTPDTRDYLDWLLTHVCRL